MDGEQCLAHGLVERIGEEGSMLKHHRHDGVDIKQAIDIPDHSAAIQAILDTLLSPEHGVLKNLSEIDAVGHRVVHGGEKFSGSVVINDAVMQQLEDCIDLAPLHNPPNIKGIKACVAHMGDIPQVGVFDTAFHQKMPEYAYLYALPYAMYEKYGLRRYGFHGTSHRYVADRAAEMMDSPLSDLKLVTCHLGNGASSAAVSGGISVDTTMGFTPAEGLVMGTRTGDLDPAALLYLMTAENLDTNQANNLINKKSGLIGISGVSNDMREIEESAETGHHRSQVALDMFAYRVKKYIGAYAAAMGGLDGVIFTGGIGENSSIIRRKALAGLEFMGIKLNEEKNYVRSSDERFVDDNSAVKVMVIPTNEELVIARDTLELIA